MRREDIPKLLGGYATNTLTPEERKALFAAALEDQALFDALAAEEALRETLEDPQARRAIERALEERPQNWLSRVWAALRAPRVWALSAAVAGAVIVGAVAIQVKKKEPAAFEMAKLQTPAPRPATEPAPAAPAAPPQDLSKVQPQPERRLRAAAPERARDYRYSPGLAAPLMMPPSETERVEEKAKLERPPALADTAVRTVGPTLALRASAPAPPSLPARVESPPSVMSEENLRQIPRGNENASMARQNQMANWAALPDQKPRKAGGVAAASLGVVGGAAMGGAVRADEAPVRYTLLGRDKDAEYVRLDAVDSAQGLRVQLEPVQAGYLYALSGEDVLLSVYAVPGGRYLVEPRPQDKELTVILSPVPEPGRITGSKVLSETRGAKKEAKLEEPAVRRRSVLRIALPGR